MGLENPCFCISLRRGAFIIACLEIVFGIIGALLAGIGIGSAAFLDSQPEPLNNTTNSTTISPAEVKENDITLSWVYVVLSLFMVYCILQVVFGFVLVFGLKKEKLMLLKVWLAFKVSGIVFSLGTFVAFIFLQENATIKPSIVDGISFMFSIYCIYVVYVVAVDIKKQITGPVKPFRG